MDLVDVAGGVGVARLPVSDLRTVRRKRRLTLEAIASGESPHSPGRNIQNLNSRVARVARMRRRQLDEYDRLAIRRPGQGRGGRARWVINRKTPRAGRQPSSVSAVGWHEPRVRR